MLFRAALLLSSFAFVPCIATAAVTSVTVEKRDLGGTGEIRYHHDDSGTTATCETIIIIGVGCCRVDQSRI